MTTGTFDLAAHNARFDAALAEAYDIVADLFAAHGDVTRSADGEPTLHVVVYPDDLRYEITVDELGFGEDDVDHPDFDAADAIPHARYIFDLIGPDGREFRERLSMVTLDEALDRAFRY